MNEKENAGKPAKAVKSSLPEFAPELTQQFISYFKARYPNTRSIKIGRNRKRYTVTVRYRAEEHPQRVFHTVAMTYEQLVMRTDFCYMTVRGQQPMSPVH